MKRKQLTGETGLYLFAFILALAFRLVYLGRVPLTDSEAGAALQALNLAGGTLERVAVLPGYTVLTGILFFLFEPSNFLARLWPALAGSALVWAPYLMRKFMGRRSAILAALFLAIDPVLVSASRQVDGRMLTVAFVLLIAVLISRRQKLWAGAAAAGALLGGSPVWMLLLGGALVAGWDWLIARRTPAVEDAGAPDRAEAIESKTGRTQFLAGLAGGLILGGTLFLLVPGSLSAILDSLVDFFNGWRDGQGARLLTVLIGLLVYELLPLVLGIYRGVRSAWARDPFESRLARMALVFLLLVMIFPSRQVADLYLVSLPLIFLAARQVYQLFVGSLEDRITARVLAAIIAALVVFSWINLAGLTSPGATAFDDQIRLLSVVGTLSVCVLITLLIAWGWSLPSALRGSGSAVVAFLLVYSFSAAVNAGRLGRLPYNELISPDAFPSEADLMLQTIEQTSERAKGERQVVDITVVDYESPALRWTLRSFRDVSWVSTLPSDAGPSLVITNAQQEPAWGSSYTGQDFIWRQKPSWDLFVPLEWLRWAIFRDARSDQESIALWVRSDLFPGAGPVENQPGVQ